MCVASQGKLEKIRLSLRLTKLDRPLRRDGPVLRLLGPHAASRIPTSSYTPLETIADEPARCTVIEDTPSGVTAAVAADMRASASQPTATRRRCERPARRSSSRWTNCQGCWDSADRDLDCCPPAMVGVYIEVDFTLVAVRPAGSKAGVGHTME